MTDRFPSAPKHGNTSAHFRPKSCVPSLNPSNRIACTVSEAHRTGRREAYTYLKEFVLQKLEVPDWLLDPMPKLPRMTRHLPSRDDRWFRPRAERPCVHRPREWHFSTRTFAWVIPPDADSSRKPGPEYRLVNYQVTKNKNRITERHSVGDARDVRDRDKMGKGTKNRAANSNLQTLGQQAKAFTLHIWLIGIPIVALVIVYLYPSGDYIVFSPELKEHLNKDDLRALHGGVETFLSKYDRPAHRQLLVSNAEPGAWITLRSDGQREETLATSSPGHIRLILETLTTSSFQKRLE